MAKIQTRNKQNPKLQQSELKDGRASLYLEYYLGRTESPVLDEDGNQVFYTTGAMAGKPKFKVKHDRRKENLNLYIWLHPRNQEERIQNKNTLALAEKIRFEREQAFLEDRAGYRLKKDRQISSPISRRNVNRKGSLTMSASRLSRLTTVSSVFSRKHRDTVSMIHSCTWKP